MVGITDGITSEKSYTKPLHQLFILILSTCDIILTIYYSLPRVLRQTIDEIIVEYFGQSTERLSVCHTEQIVPIQFIGDVL